MPDKSYDKAIIRFSSDEKKKIKATLNNWSRTQKGQTIVQNLTNLERFLPENCMFYLLRVIKDNHLGLLETLLSEYERECRNHKSRGGQVDKSVVPKVVGKVIERKYFCKWLRENYGKRKGTKKLFRSQKQADRFIDKLIAAVPLSRRFDVVLLGSLYFIWVTWDEDFSKEPFNFIKYKMAEEARCCLGLEPNPGKRLILLTYKRPKEMMRPTIADAGTFTFFQPAPPFEERHGLTKPWEPALLSNKLKKIDKNYEPLPRPEAIHKADLSNITLLTSVIELL